MYKAKIIIPYTDSVAMIMWRDIMPEIGEYETVFTTPSIVYDTYLHVL